MTRFVIALMMGLLIARAGAQEPVRTADINLRGLKATDFPRVTKLAENVFAFEQIDPTKRTVTVNNLIVVTQQGVLIAEGQGTRENVQRLVAAVAKITPQPIKYVVVGSEHGDHTAGDSAFPSGVTFLVHPFSRANFERQVQDRRPDGPKFNPYSETVDSTRVLRLGGTEIQILFLGRAHTGGDLEVYLPGEKILFMSEVFSNRIFPSMANSYPTEWIKTLQRAESMDVRVYVPAHGFVDSAAILNEEERNYRHALEQIIAEGTRLHAAGVPIDAAPASANFASFDNWTRSANNAAAALKR